jgi:hypothetical protein
LIGENPITAEREKKLRQLADKATHDIIQVNLTRSELRLFAAHWCWIQSENMMKDESEDQLKFLKLCLGLRVVNNIKKKVMAYEMQKARVDNDMPETEIDFPEEDYDTYYCR